MGGLPLREGERESGASWSISLRQSPKPAAAELTRLVNPSLLNLPDRPPHRQESAVGRLVLDKCGLDLPEQ